MIAYRVFEIDVELSQPAEDLHDVTFQIKGGRNLHLGMSGPSPSALRPCDVEPKGRDGRSEAGDGVRGEIADAAISC